MKAKELKDALASVPDDTDIVIETTHTIYDWEDDMTDDIETEHVPDAGRNVPRFAVCAAVV